MKSLDKIKPYIRYKNAGSQHVRGKRGYSPKGIVLHTMDGGSDYDGRLEGWLDNPESMGASHYGIGFSGLISNYVNPAYIAIVSSSPQANRDYLACEFADMGNPNDSKRTPALYNSGARLLAYLAIRYRWGRLQFNKNVFLHKQFTSRKPCPGRLDYERIIREANVYYDLYTAQPAAVEEGVVVDEPIESGANLPIIEKTVEKTNPFTSRKFLLTLGVIILFVALGILDIRLPDELITAILVAAGGYLGVEGAADIVSRAKQTGVGIAEQVKVISTGGGH